MSRKYEIGCVTDNEDKFFAEVREVTLSQIVTRQLSDSKPVSIGKLYKKSKDLLLDEVALIILDLCNFYNVKNNLTERQLMDVSYMIVSDYKHLNLLDLGLCFNEVKRSKRGKIYDRIDGGMIMDWIRTYEHERTEAIVSYRKRESDLHKGDNSERSSETTLGKFLKKWGN